MEVNLFSVKPDNDGSDIYYVPATSYEQAVERYKAAVGGQTDANGVVIDPDKVTIVCRGDRLIMPSIFDIDS